MIRIILAALAGLVLGSVVNMLLISLGGMLIALPEGVDNTTMEGLANSIELFEVQHYLFPFLAHALGTFCGAFSAILLAKSHQRPIALFIGCSFLCGGIWASVVLPAPIWFIIIDIFFAYLPMAWGAHLLWQRK